MTDEYEVASPTAATTPAPTSALSTTPMEASGVGRPRAPEEGSAAGTPTAQAQQVGQDVKQALTRVSDVTSEQAQNVATEARAQARGLLDQARGQVNAQAATQQDRAAEWVHGVADELRGMLDRSGSDRRTDPEEGGVATQAVRRLSTVADDVARWLDEHEPSDAMTEITRFARRRPGLFLALAVGAGLVAGRVTRGLAAATDDRSGDPASLPTPPDGARNRLPAGFPAVGGTDSPTPAGTDESSGDQLASGLAGAEEARQ